MKFGLADSTLCAAQNRSRAGPLRDDRVRRRAARAAPRRVAPGADFRRGDVCALDHPDDTFDLVTTVYTLRNFPDLRRGVREMYRVTAPGGAVVILDRE